jgi:hypothetical protein
MAAEVNLKPGWLTKDGQRATDRVNQWSVSHTRLAERGSGSHGDEAGHKATRPPDQSSRSEQKRT